MPLRDRPLLLPWFCLAALVCFVALGVTLHRVVAGELRDQAIAHDGHAAAHLAAMLAPDVVSAGRRLGARGERRIEDFLTIDHHGEQYLQVRVWDRQLRLLSGTAEDGAARLGAARRSALAGRAEGLRHAGPDVQAVVHYVVPVQAGAGDPVGVLEVTQRARQLDRQIAQSSTRVTTILAIGLAVLYVALLPLLARTSRRLRAHARELSRLALTDDLTGLPNRRALRRRLEQEALHDAPTALVLLDLDGFKAVNTVEGQSRGDEVLAAAARRLDGAMRDAFVARLGGDEFAIVVTGTRTAAIAAAERACAALATAGGERITATAGVAWTVGDVHALLQQASAALAAARAAGVRVQAYEPGQELALRGIHEQRAEIESLLADPGALEIAFQPAISLSTGEVLFHEALARIGAEPRRGPDLWFAQAHRVGLGVELELLAVRRALAAAAERGIGRLSLNASPSCIASRQMLDALPARLDHVIVELTEHELANVDDLEGPLGELRRRGARIAVDDVGAGYAGLRQVVRVAPEVIKLDRELVTGVDASAPRIALIDALVHFARRSGALICAEGIESLAELRALADLDVAAGQGYLIARPGDRPDVSAAAVTACHDGLVDALRTAPGAGHFQGLDAIEQLGDALGQVRQLDELAGVIARLTTILHAEEVSFSLLDEDDDAVVGISGEEWTREDRRYRLSDYPVTRRVVESGRAVQVLRTDPGADPGELEYLVEAGYGSVLMVPVVQRGQTLGLIEAYASEARPWTRTEILRARVACHLLGAVIGGLRAAA